MSISGQFVIIIRESAKVRPQGNSDIAKTQKYKRLFANSNQSKYRNNWWIYFVLTNEGRLNTI